MSRRHRNRGVDLCSRGFMLKLRPVPLNSASIRADFRARAACLQHGQDARPDAPEAPASPLLIH